MESSLGAAQADAGYSGSRAGIGVVAIRAIRRDVIIVDGTWFIAGMALREPQGEITHIELRVGQRLRRADDGIARRFIDKARTAQSRIPIVVGEMVKGA
jgi:energy-converting hydrogenase Eha subunit B